MLALSSKRGLRVETTSIYQVDRMQTVSRVVSHGVCGPWWQRSSGIRLWQV